MKRKKIKLRGFVMVEIVMAMGLVMLLLVCYWASVKGLDKMDKAFSNDARSLQAVSNTVERLARKSSYGNAEIKKVFLDEFNKGGFTADPKITPLVKTEADGSKLALLRANGKAIIEVKIKCRK
jgi:4-amino-4-deoxy-L-arabinose transferase-like glycosyltransferase